MEIVPSDKLRCGGVLGEGHVTKEVVVLLLEVIFFHDSDQKKN